MNKPVLLISRKAVYDDGCILQMRNREVPIEFEAIDDLIDQFPADVAAIWEGRQ